MYMYFHNNGFLIIFLLKLCVEYFYIKLWLLAYGSTLKKCNMFVYCIY